MGNIRTTGATPRVPQPTATAAQQGALVGQAVGDLSRAVGDLGAKLEARATQNDITAINAQAATDQAELTNAWMVKLGKAELTDTGLSQRFLDEDVSDRMDALSELATTRDAQAHASRLRAGITGHFISTTAKGQADLAGQAAVLSYETVLNQLTNTISADPAALDGIIELNDIMLEDMVNRGDLTRSNMLKLRSKSRKKLAMAQAFAVIERSPGSLKELEKSGLYNEYLDRVEIASLLSTARAAETALEVEGRRVRTAEATTVSNDIFEAMVNSKGEFAPTPDTVLDILRAPELDTPEGFPLKRILVSMVQSGNAANKSGKALETNGELFRRLAIGARLEKDDPARTTREMLGSFFGNGLSPTAYNQLVNFLENEDSPEGKMRNAFMAGGLERARIELRTQPNVAILDPEGAKRLFNFEKFAWQMEQKLEDEDVPVAERWADDGPIMKELERFKRSPREALEDMIRIMQGMDVVTPGIKFEDTQTPAEGVRTPEQLKKLLEDNE
jgi:hypothetical protein